MAEIQPFAALRFTKQAGAPEDYCCPPYDIISPGEQSALHERSPYNVIRLELSQERDPYKAAAAYLDAWLRDGILRRETIPALYLYRQSFVTLSGETRQIDGLLARVKLSPQGEGMVLPHEETLSGPKEDRFQLMCALQCNVSPIYCLYRDVDRVTVGRLGHCFEEKPIQCFSLPAGGGHIGNITHSLWRITNTGLIEDLQRDFATRRLFIADGHHRYETALRYRDAVGATGASDTCLMLLADAEHPGLTVYPTHRMVHGMATLDQDSLLSALQTDFIVERRVFSQESEAIGGVTFDGEILWTLIPRVGRGLDAVRLQSLILGPYLGIDADKLAGQTNLSYTRRAVEAAGAVRDGSAQCAFLVQPTRVEDIVTFSELGKKMPQKSTYFYPKPVTGLMIHDLRA